MSIDEKLDELREWMAKRLEVGESLPRVLTKERAARELSVSKSKLNALIRAGELGTVLIGKVKMVPRAEILRIEATVKFAGPPRREDPRRSPSENEGDKIRALNRRKRS